MIEPSFYKFKDTKFFKQLTDNPDILAIYLAGSKAFGFDSEYSDYDVLVICDKQEVPERPKQLFFSGYYLTPDGKHITINKRNIHELLSAQIHYAYSFTNIFWTGGYLKLLYTTDRYNKFLDYCKKNEKLFLDYQVVSAANFYKHTEKEYNHYWKMLESILAYSLVTGEKIDWDTLKEYKRTRNFPIEVVNEYRNKIIKWSDEHYPNASIEEIVNRVNKEISEVVDGDEES